MVRKIKKKILVIAAHPDDEVLFCGGTVKKFSNIGHEVNLFIATNGMESREGTIDNNKIREGQSILRKSIVKSSKILGISKISYGNLPDQKLDTIPILEISKLLDNIVKKYKPQIVFTHHGGDLNKDHQILYEAVLIACRPLPGSVVKEIYVGETLSSTEYSGPKPLSYFTPDTYININETLEDKIKALKEYKIEMRHYPHSRSYKTVKNLAQLRGSHVGIESAEAFMTIRRII